MTTTSQKKKTVEELVSVNQETDLSANNLSENPVAGTSKSPKVRTKNLEGKNLLLKKRLYLTSQKSWLKTKKKCSN